MSTTNETITQGESKVRRTYPVQSLVEKDRLSGQGNKRRLINYNYNIAHIPFRGVGQSCNCD